MALVVGASVFEALSVVLRPRFSFKPALAWHWWWLHPFSRRYQPCYAPDSLSSQRWHGTGGQTTACTHVCRLDRRHCWKARSDTHVVTTL
eukprot:236794-Chlamydomonas_euryale.AAC.6